MYCVHLALKACLFLGLALSFTYLPLAAADAQEGKVKGEAVIELKAETPQAAAQVPEDNPTPTANEHPTDDDFAPGGLILVLLMVVLVFGAFVGFVILAIVTQPT